MTPVVVSMFSEWRVAARRLIAEGVAPEDAAWEDGRSSQPTLFGAGAAAVDDVALAPSLHGPDAAVGTADPADDFYPPGADVDEPDSIDALRDFAKAAADSAAVADAAGHGDVAAPPVTGPAAIQAPSRAAAPFHVPKAFVDLAMSASWVRDPSRWDRLYSVLWRLTHGEHDLLKDPLDDDARRLNDWERVVRKDAHKMKAFVRFRKCTDDAGEHFVAWHRPDHYVVRPTAPFFQRRFAVLRWSILTPDESAYWDGAELRFGPGLPRAAAPAGDDLEDLWRTYYANIFNPARVKVKMMKREMPVRHWPTLPEAEIIDDLLRQAPTRVEKMIAMTEGYATSAADFVPAGRSLAVLRESAQGCRGCPLCDVGTQTVFGEGPAHAPLMFVGEQPGDEEDVKGRPFIGPAGRMFNDIMQEIGADRSLYYVTNAVKHFDHEVRGGRRLHKTPKRRDVIACRPWLEAEIETVKPKVLVCLGATAAKSLLGPSFKLTESRGRPLQSDWAEVTLATFHPSALLRAPDPAARDAMRAAFTADLRLALEAVA